MSNRVLILIPCLLVGGTEMHTLALVTALVGGGYEVMVCAYYEHDTVMVSAIRRAGACVRLLGLDRKWGHRGIVGLRGLILGLFRVISEVQPAFVHIQYMTPGVIPVLVARAMDVPHMLATVHVPGHHYGRRLWLPRSVIARVCDVFLCVSEAAERSFFGNSRVFDEELFRAGRGHFAIPNAVDLDEVDRVSVATNVRALRCSLKLDGHPVIGMISRLSPEKGPQDLIEAMPAVIRAIPKTKLLIVGDGSLRNELTARASQLGIDDSVVWVGRVPRARAYELLCAMDVVAVPSHWEGFGLAAAEAMAFGKPVIASDVDGLREVVYHGKTGLLFKAGDTAALARGLVAILRGGDRVMGMCRAGRERVEQNFSMAAFTDRHLRLYSALASGKVGPARQPGLLRVRFTNEARA